MAHDPDRPLGMFRVARREPALGKETHWREPRWYPTLEAASFAARRIAAIEGTAFSVLEEVGRAVPVEAEPEEATAEPAAQEATTALAAAAIVAGLEWSARVDCAEGGTELGCPYCGEPQRLGHAPRCRLAASLRMGA